MSLKLYLTTDACGYRDVYTCCVWDEEPELRSTEDCIAGRWIGTMPIVVGHILYDIIAFPHDALGFLGFPPPGQMRVIEVGEYEEGEDEI